MTVGVGQAGKQSRQSIGELDYASSRICNLVQVAVGIDAEKGDLAVWRNNCRRTFVGSPLYLGHIPSIVGDADELSTAIVAETVQHGSGHWPQRLHVNVSVENVDFGTIFGGDVDVSVEPARRLHVRIVAAGTIA